MSYRRPIRRWLAGGAVLALVGSLTCGQGQASPLHDAAIAGDVALVEVLLQAGARAGVADISGLTALHYAAALGKAAVVRALLQAGADANARDVRGVAPLHLAAAGGHLEVVKALLAGGANPDPGFPVDGQAIGAARHQVQIAVDVNVDARDFDRREPPPAPESP